MKSAEWVLFDVNEAFHYANILPAEKYITVESIVFAIVMMFVAMPLILKLMNYLNDLDPYLKYTPWIIMNICFLVLYTFGGYIQIIISLSIIGLYLIVATNPKYQHIKDYIEKFF